MPLISDLIFNLHTRHIKNVKEKNKERMKVIMKICIPVGDDFPYILQYANDEWL